MVAEPAYMLTTSSDRDFASLWPAALFAEGEVRLTMRVGGAFYSVGIRTDADVVDDLVDLPNRRLLVSKGTTVHAAVRTLLTAIVKREGGADAR